jgi:signal transduction histidine kinase
LKKEIEVVSKNPVIDGLMNVVSGFLAVLNKHRQILALNETLLDMIGIGDAEKVLGLRPGEAVRCIHAQEMPGGCGTTEFCSTCGAAIAIVTSLGQNKPMERTCAVTVDKNGKKEDLYMRVRSCPITYDNSRLLLLFLQDITHQQKWAALERVFFHDINNIVTGLSGATELFTLEKGNVDQTLARKIHQLSLRLAKEVDIQRCLAQTELCTYQPALHKVSVAQVFKEIEDVFSNHPAAKNKFLTLPEIVSDLSFKTDFSILTRVLNNMLINAFEATDEGGQVKSWVERSPAGVTFFVWNRNAIPKNITKRIFQRNFSTKPENGRGLGTYSMKLFGEEFLGGKVDFTTSDSEGTVFRFCLNI